MLVALRLLALGLLVAATGMAAGRHSWRQQEQSRRQLRLLGIDRSRHTNNLPSYDVLQIECPAAQDGMERFPCPTPNQFGRYMCIDGHMLCNGFIECPGAEDEHRQNCMFYKTTRTLLPAAPYLLVSSGLSDTEAREELVATKAKQKRVYDRSARPLPTVQSGDVVWV